MINHALKKDTMINQHVLDLNIFLTTISYNDEVASINNATVNTFILRD